MIAETILFQLAKSKGFEAATDDITGDYLALCSIQKWLMDKHDIYIAVLPGFGGFSFIAGTPDNLKLAPNSFNMGASKTWKSAYLQAICEALNLLP